MKIDQNIPVPKNIRTRGNKKYPWKEMNIGDSFTVPAPMLNSMRSYCNNVSRKLNLKFIARIDQQPGEIHKCRIWRVE